MGIGVSVFLLAVGAIVAFAVEVDSVDVFDVNAIGIILMIAGLIGLLWSLIVMSTRRREYVEERPVRRVYEDPI